MADKHTDFDFDFDELFAADNNDAYDLPYEEDYPEEEIDWLSDGSGEEDAPPAEPVRKRSSGKKARQETPAPEKKPRKKQRKEPGIYEEDRDILPTEEDEEAQRLRRRKSRRRWRTFLLIWSVCLLIVGAVGCCVLYKYLDSYEISRPEHVMDELMASTTPEQWYAHALEGFDPALSRYDDKEQLFADYYDAALADANYTYRKDSAASAEEAPAYVIRAGAVELCRVTLKSVGDAGFGMHLWEKDRVETVFSLKSLQSVAVEIDAPADQTLYLNGVELDASSIVDENVPCPNVTELEKRFLEQPHFVRYRVDTMYGSINVTDSEGSTLATVDSGSDDTVRYLLPEKDFYSFTVTAPSDVVVTIGGAVLSPEDVTKSEAGVLDELEKYTGDGAYETVTYQIDGLYTQPEITAVDKNGNALQPVINGENGEKLTFFHAHDEALYKETHEYVENFFECYMNYSQQAYSEGNYYALLNCIQGKTDLYNYIRDSVDAMYWASNTKVTYEELTFTDFASVNEDCFTCTIRYKADMAAQAWYESYTYGLQNAYQMVFVRVEDRWLAAAMSIV